MLNKNVLNTTNNGELDRTQLLIETIRAAQAAHAKQLESGTIDSDDETDAVVKPMEPESELKKEKSDEDEIEIIHMTDEPESIR